MSLTRDRLLADFHAAGKPREQWRVGAEFERHLLRPDGSPLPYFGEHGVQWLLEQLPAHGYSLYHEGEHPIAAFKDSHNVTLEPGSQFLERRQLLLEHGHPDSVRQDVRYG